MIISAWASNRNYASIGGLRGVAQTISYEVRFGLIILFIVMPVGGRRIRSIMLGNGFWAGCVLFPPILGLWLITCVAETNRTPFDFAEGESELVSGFNIEYGSVGFAMIFMAEYSRIYFISVLFRLVFFSGSLMRGPALLLPRVLVYFWVWLRVTLPRYRYDILISLAWGRILPLMLGGVSFCLIFRAI